MSSTEISLLTSPIECLQTTDSSKFPQYGEQIQTTEPFLFHEAQPRLNLTWTSFFNPNSHPWRLLNSPALTAFIQKLSSSLARELTGDLRQTHTVICDTIAPRLSLLISISSKVRRLGTIGIMSKTLAKCHKDMEQSIRLKPVVSGGRTVARVRRPAISRLSMPELYLLFKAIGQASLDRRIPTHSGRAERPLGTFGIRVEGFYWRPTERRWKTLVRSNGLNAHISMVLGHLYSRSEARTNS